LGSGKKVQRKIGERIKDVEYAPTTRHGESTLCLLEGKSGHGATNDKRRGQKNRHPSGLVRKRGPEGGVYVRTDTGQVTRIKSDVLWELLGRSQRKRKNAWGTEDYGRPDADRPFKVVNRFDRRHQRSMGRRGTEDRKENFVE